VEAVAISHEARYGCVGSAMQQFGALHDRDLVDIVDLVQRNRPRDHLGRPLGEACAGRKSMEAVTGCLEVIEGTCEADRVDIVTATAVAIQSPPGRRSKSAGTL
jgi:hypothetical protein